jgi:chondroitin AC lyase
MEGNKNTIRVLSNTKAIQAMSYPAQHLTAITFYRPGSITVEGIPVEVDKPCILMLKHSGNTIALHAADPYQREAQLAVTFGARLEGKGVTYDGQAGKSRVSVVLPGGLEKGSTVRYELTVRR